MHDDELCGAARHAGQAVQGLYGFLAVVRVLCHSAWQPHHYLSERKTAKENIRGCVHENIPHGGIEAVGQLG